VVALAVLAGACGGGSSSTGDDGASTQTLTVGLAYDVGGLGDGGPNDAALVGLSKAKDELGAEVQTFEPDSTGSDRADVIDLLAEGDADLVIGIGAGYGAAIQRAARQHPDTWFAIVDDDSISGKNIMSLGFMEEQSAYLVGAAATLSSSAHHLGFLGGPDDARMQLLQAGFTAGARKVVPSTRVDVAHLPPPADGAPLDPAPAKDLALGLFAAGAQVVLAAPASIDPTVFAAAVEKGGSVRAIGVDSDQFTASPPALQPVVFTSTLKRVDLAVFEAVQAVAGDQAHAGARRLGLADDAVGYATSGGLLAPDVLARLEELKAQIIGGQIQVPTVP
jgi:basic membrane protein A